VVTVRKTNSENRLLKKNAKPPLMLTSLSAVGKRFQTSSRLPRSAIGKIRHFHARLIELLVAPRCW
jgi:hypothetical protein